MLKALKPQREKTPVVIFGLKKVSGPRTDVLDAVPKGKAQRKTVRVAGKRFGRRACTGSNTTIECPAKGGDLNPEHLVDAIFGTHSSSTAQQLFLEFFDSNGATIHQVFVTRG